MKAPGFLFSFALGLCATVTLAQEKATLVGTVRDADTGEGLAGCNLFIAGTSTGTASDAKGNFQLAGVPYGTLILVAQFIGYESRQLQLEVRQPVTRVNLRLRAVPVPGPAVTVIGTRATARETPVAFATLENRDLQTRYFAQDIPVLLSELPSTTFYSENGNGIGYNYLSIRGFDQRRISVLINGVPQNDPEDHNVYWIDFPDLPGNVRDIQVQRGAGSAFYGPPAIGGSVNIVTADLPTKAGLHAYAGGGTYNTSKFSLTVSSGLLGERYLLFGRASRIRSDGYRERSWVDLKSYALGAARVGEKSITRLHFQGGPIEDHLAYYGIAKALTARRETRRDNPIRRPDEIENFNQPQLQLLHEYRPHARLRLNNTLFVMRGCGFFDYDGAWAPLSYYRLTPEYGFDVSGDPGEIYVDSLLIRAYVDNRQVGWLPQLTWSHARGEITLGAELRRHRSLHWGRIQKGDADLPPAVAGEYRGFNYLASRRYYEYRGGKDILSAYAHSAQRLLAGLNMMLDLQFVHSRYRFYRERHLGHDFDVPYNFVNPRAGLNYNVNEQINLFVNFSRTSREPRLKNLYDAAEASTPASWGAVVPQFAARPDGSPDFDRPLVRPEKLNDLELGLGFRHGGWRAACNLYHMDFRDEIIKKGQLDRFGQPVTGNAERTLHRGIELLVTGRLLPGLTLSANAMISENNLKKYTVYTDEGPAVLDNNPIAGFPNVLANARLTYSAAGLTASLALQHAGKQYTDNFKNEANTVAAYTVVHGSMAYRFSRGALAGMTAQLHVQNLFDTLYNTHGEGEDFFPAAERQVFAGINYEL